MDGIDQKLIVYCLNSIDDYMITTIESESVQNDLVGLNCSKF